MDKKSKVIIGALIVIGVVFAVGLGTNLLNKEGEGTGKKEDVDKYKREGWIGSMDNMLGRFSPRLDVRRLLPLPDCDPRSGLRPPNCRDAPADFIECSRNGNVLTFTGNAECGINIRPRLPGCDNDYQSTTLKLAKGAAATRAAAARIKMKPVLMQAQPFSRDKPELAAITPKLTVKYQPNGKTEEKVNLQGEKEIRLVVLEQGGTLKLSCTGCSKNQPVEVILATRESCD